MMRSMVLLSAVLGACTVGEAPPSDGGGGTADRTVCEPRAGNIPPAYNHVTAPNGPRARMGCMDATCHAMGGAGGQFAFAGTVYKETSATTAAQGVTVRIFKAGNPTSLAEAVTDDAGNFVIRMPAMFADFPYETHVTACGTSIEIRPMVAPITATDANCNLGGGCHGATGLQGAIYMPD